MRFTAWNSGRFPGTHHRVLTENREFRANEAELVHILVGVEFGEDLLHVDAHVEDLAVVELIGVVTVVLSGAVESLDNVGADEGGVVDEFVDKGDTAVVSAGPDQARAALHVSEHTLDDLSCEPVRRLFLFHDLLCFWLLLRRFSALFPGCFDAALARAVNAVASADGSSSRGPTPPQSALVSELAGTGVESFGRRDGVSCDGVAWYRFALRRDGTEFSLPDRAVDPGVSIRHPDGGSHWGPHWSHKGGGGKVGRRPSSAIVRSSEKFRARSSSQFGVLSIGDSLETYYQTCQGQEHPHLGSGIRFSGACSFKIF